MSSAPGDRMNDLIVVSDLHLGRGRNAETGRFHALEAFFFDDDFAGFCRHLVADAQAREMPFTLVLAGDVLDLLRIEPEKAPPGARAAERRYGPPITPAYAATLAGHVVAGHPRFFAALAQVLAAGNDVVLLPGNHDVELQWAPVQEVIRRAVGGDTSRLRFAPWFYFEPGRIWIEHGCQYDPDGAFEYPLRGPLGRRPDFAGAERDLPLGNFFQHYLFNGFGALASIVPTTSANGSYLRWLALHRPRFLARVLADHLPFLRQLIRRWARSPAGSSELADVHRSELARISVESGLDSRLLAVDALKAKRPDIVHAVQGASRRLLEVGIGGALVVLAALTLWMASLQAIDDLAFGLGMKALLYLLLNLIVAVGAATLMVSWLLRGPGRDQAPAMPIAARRIAELLDVPLVCFGHSHEESIVRLERGWYFNTGTWIGVFMHDALLPRERVQLTFLRVRETSGELLYWSSARGEALPAILLDE